MWLGLRVHDREASRVSEHERIRRHSIDVFYDVPATVVHFWHTLAAASIYVVVKYFSEGYKAGKYEVTWGREFDSSEDGVRGCIEYE